MSLEKTSVITVFLKDKEGKIALFRRSSRVGTYQGRWAGISGYLEGDPENHFRIEIEEETGLKPDDYTFIRSSEPIKIKDDRLGKIWIVHPFLCLVDNPDKIVLDWENTELRWVEPDEIRTLETVPGLARTFKAVSSDKIINKDHSSQR